MHSDYYEYCAQSYLLQLQQLSLQLRGVLLAALSAAHRLRAAPCRNGSRVFFSCRNPIVRSRELRVEEIYLVEEDEVRPPDLPHRCPRRCGECKKRVLALGERSFAEGSFVRKGCKGVGGAEAGGFLLALGVRVVVVQFGLRTR